MTINQRQFTQLKEMGIELWQRRELAEETAPNLNKIEQHSIIDVDLGKLVSQTLFSDILLCFQISPVEVSQNGQQLNLGLFNWQFSEGNTISVKNNTLTTPAIAEIQNDPELKATLWLTLNQNNLI